MTLYPSPDLPDFLNAVLRWRRDYEQMCRDIVGEKSPRALTSGKRGPAFTEGEMADEPMLPIRDCPEELIRLEAFIGKARSLADLGVYQIAEFKLFSRCTRHGYITTNVVTTDIEPNVGSFRCHPCLTEGITKWLPVTLVERVGGEK